VAGAVLGNDKAAGVTDNFRINYPSYINIWWFRPIIGYLAVVADKTISLHATQPFY